MAVNLRILEVSQRCDYADYFVLMSATSARQARALADAILRENNVMGVEGYSTGDWILLDLGNVVAHIFYDPMRSCYNLDKLWADCPTVELNSEPSRLRAGHAVNR